MVGAFIVRPVAGAPEGHRVAQYQLCASEWAHAPQGVP